MWYAEFVSVRQMNGEPADVRMFQIKESTQVQSIKQQLVVVFAPGFSDVRLIT